MKTLIVSVGGTPTPGDLVMLMYTHPSRGGCSALKYKVKQPVDTIETDAKGAKKVVAKSDTAADVVAGLLNELNCGQAWPLGEFQGASREDATSFIVKCSDLLSDVQFSTEIQGAKTLTVGLEML